MNRILAACLLSSCAAYAAAAADPQFLLPVANGPAVAEMLRAHRSTVPQPTAAVVPETGSVPSACYEQARAKNPELTTFWAAQLCGGAATSEAPVDCYGLAKRETDLTAFGRVNLCAGASSASAPVGCYRKSSELNDLTGFGRAQLCSAAATVEGPIACYRANLGNRELTAFTRVKLCARL